MMPSCGAFRASYHDEITQQSATKNQKPTGGSKPRSSFEIANNY